MCQGHITYSTQGMSVVWKVKKKSGKETLDFPGS